MINLTEILDFVNKNPWLNIVFIILTLASMILTAWFYFKSKKNKKPTFCTRTVNLVKEKINKIDSVDILYHGQKIDNLSISKMAIWNAGKETISSSDIAKNDRFRVEIDENDKILDFELIFERKKANGFKLTKHNDNTLFIEFDYFDYNEGIIIQIYHTATDGSSLNLKGSFKGTEQINRVQSKGLFPKFFYMIFDLKFLTPKMTKNITGAFTIILPIILFYSIFIEQHQTQPQNLSVINKIILICMVTIPYWWLGYRMLKRRVPRAFYLFENVF